MRNIAIKVLMTPFKTELYIAYSTTLFYINKVRPTRCNETSRSF